MDYCIYKTTDGANPRIIHTFTQAATYRKAKRAAKGKLHDMWLRICTKPTQYHNAHGNDMEFSYSYPLTSSKTVIVRFFIAPAPKTSRIAK